jgi:hypothetical protein
MRLLRTVSGQLQGGSLVVLTSRRTPTDVARAISSSLPSQAKLFLWRNDGQDNPYRGILGLADRFVVTGDSVSMIGDVLRLQKPLSIAQAPLRSSPLVRLEQMLARKFRATNPNANGPWPWLKRSLHTRGRLPFARDFLAFHTRLVDQGAATLLDDELPHDPKPLPEDMPRIVARIHALIDSGTTSERAAR